jgi:multidrug efflux pump subunit AcrA (membrane-fusion protein)
MIALTACGALTAAPVADAGAAQEGHPSPVGMPVVVSQVHKRNLPASMRLVGTVLADRSAVVAAEVEGLVAELLVREGSQVRAGQALCRVDAAVAQLRVEEGRARLAGLRARLEELEHGTRPEEIRRAEESVAEAEAIVARWEFERNRIAGLFELQQSNPKEKHDAEMSYLAARRRLAQEQAMLERWRNGARPEELAAARSDVAAQDAVVRRLEHDLARTEVKAPFDGFIVGRRTEVGQWIQAGGAVCELVSLDPVKVRADVPESTVRFARVGASATVEIEALDAARVAAIARVIPRALESARTFPIEIDLPNADHALLAGMFVWVHVPAGPPGERLMLNRDCIVPAGREKTIFVLRPGPAGGQMAIPTPVTTGIEVAGEVEVQASGLQAGDLVVSRANERLHGPTPVFVLEQRDPPPPVATEPIRAGDPPPVAPLRAPDTQPVDNVASG